MLGNLYTCLRLAASAKAGRYFLEFCYCLPKGKPEITLGDVVCYLQPYHPRELYPDLALKSGCVGFQTSTPLENITICISNLEKDYHSVTTC